MLKSLHLKDFQAHKKLSVQLAPGITTIKGPSDVGKSAVLRALRWLCLNASVEDIVRHGEKSALVKLHLEDGKWVGRGKGSVGNVYMLSGAKLVSFGQDVPEKVAQLLAMNEINFQRQHDQPFWLDESAPEVSRQLNRVVDLSVIDQAMASAAKLVRTAKERVNVSEARLDEKRADRDRLKLVEPRINKFVELGELYTEYEQAKQNRSELERIVSVAAGIDLKFIERRERAAGQVFELAKALVQIQKRRVELKSLVDDLQNNAGRIVELPKFSPIRNAWAELQAVREKAEDLAELIPKLKEAEELADVQVRYAKKLREEMAEYACPLCGRKK